MTVRASYVLLVDGYCEHPYGEILIEAESWERLKQYHIAIAKHYISVSSSGGSESNALQILASRGAKFIKYAADPVRSAFVTDDD